MVRKFTCFGFWMRGVRIGIRSDASRPSSGLVVGVLERGVVDDLAIKSFKEGPVCM